MAKENSAVVPLYVSVRLHGKWKEYCQRNGFKMSKKLSLVLEEYLEGQ